jgi:uncharacterized protein (TIGR02271 family)
MKTGRRDVVVGVFRDHDRAREAIEALKDAGIRGQDISVLLPDREQTRDVAADTGTQAAGGAATGAVAGGVLGGLGGWLVGIGALAIPGVGPFIAAGAFATALTGAAIGAGVGAIAGALIGMGIPEEEAKYYEGEVHSGRALVTVRADGRYDEAQRILRHYGAYDMETRDAVGAMAGAPGATAGRWDDERPRYRQRWQERYGTTGARWEDAEPAYRYGWEMRHDPRYRDRTWTDTEPELRRDWETRYHDKPWDRARQAIQDAWEERSEDRARVQLREEELRARKETVQTGEAVVRKDVVTERQSVDVPVTREEAYVERRPVTPHPADSADFGTGREEIRVPVREEQVRVEKRPVVTEEVTVRKQPVRETERVSGTVRKEVARVERTGDVPVRGDASSGRWEDESPRFRAEWERTYGTAGGRWEDYEPAYRYGWETRRDPRYQGRDWSAVEPEVRRDWESRYPNTPWERAGAAIREAWERRPGR